MLYRPSSTNVNALSSPKASRITKKYGRNSTNVATSTRNAAQADVEGRAGTVPSRYSNSVAKRGPSRERPRDGWRLLILNAK